jgi:hypothetical protein
LSVLSDDKIVLHFPDGLNLILPSESGWTEAPKVLAVLFYWTVSSEKGSIAMRKLLTLKNEATPPRLSDSAGPLNCSDAGSGSGNGLTLPQVAREEKSLSENNSSLPYVVTEYWVNVQRDGAERKFAQEPMYCLTLHVWVCGDREYTATFHS